MAFSIALLVLALPLVVFSGVLAVKVVGNLPGSRGGFLPLSVALTFALFFATLAWRGFASIGRTGPALTVRGWRLLAGAFVLVAAVGAIGHWAGLLLPLVVAWVCLGGDPVMARVRRWIGMGVLGPGPHEH